MRRKSKTSAVIAIMAIMLSITVVFNESISSKPSEAGFWMILGLGISIGVALNHFISIWKK